MQRSLITPKSLFNTFIIIWVLRTSWHPSVTFKYFILVCLGDGSSNSSAFPPPNLRNSPAAKIREKLGKYRKIRQHRALRPRSPSKYLILIFGQNFVKNVLNLFQICSMFWNFIKILKNSYYLCKILTRKILTFAHFWLVSFIIFFSRIFSQNILKCSTLTQPSPWRSFCLVILVPTDPSTLPTNESY